MAVNYDAFSTECQKTFARAYHRANMLGHGTVTLDHILYEALDDVDVGLVLKGSGLDNLRLGNLKTDLCHFLENDLSHLKKDVAIENLGYDLATENVLKQTLKSVPGALPSGDKPDDFKKGCVSMAHILMFALDHSYGYAVKSLKYLGVDKNYINHNLALLSLDKIDPDAPAPKQSLLSHKPDQDKGNPAKHKGVSDNAGKNLSPQQPQQKPAENQKDEPAEENSNKDPFADLCVNLNEKAQKGRIDPLIGRDDEVEHTIRILGRRKKNNPLLVGEPGVGKTAVAEGLAKRIADGTAGPMLEDATIYSLNIGDLLAGTKYRGDVEMRVKKVVEKLEEDEDAILFIDEIHTIVGGGATSEGAMDIANLLKPKLADGSIRCLGATTYKEYRNHFEKNPALVRRFQKIDIEEPTPDEARAILEGLRERYERHHNVRFTAEALDAAVSLSAKYMTDKKLPDKAVDVIDEAGSRARMQYAEGRPDYEPEDDYSNANVKRTAVIARRPEAAVIDVEDIEYIVAKLARMPEKRVSHDDLQMMENLGDTLKSVVFHQDEAIEELSDAIQLSRAGLRHPEKPVGNYLFAGPTGVGKTELVRQLSETLGMELIRFDMSEYMEKHAVAGLIGTAPGYVGFDQGGLLTDAVDRNPHSIILLDEIEKAHPEMFNILLQVMDYGKLTDNKGKKIDFRNTMIVMTTNAGVLEMQQNDIGFAARHDDSEAANEKALAAINEKFSPEFRNRLDAVIQFKSLPEEGVALVSNKFLGEMEQQLADRNVTVSLTEQARKYLEKDGYNPQMGARPMERVIQEKVKKRLAKEILFGALKNGGHVDIDYDESGDGQEQQDGGLSFRFTEAAAGRRTPVNDDAQDYQERPENKRKQLAGAGFKPSS